MVMDSMGFFIIFLNVFTSKLRWPLVIRSVMSKNKFARVNAAKNPAKKRVLAEL